ncbi:hypothetical protein HNR57_007816 [Streptomyces paradoxus]|uniref:Uncharacterized protein n=1 Tax=Streptomyces paradoxus TaxID=66375 RepID=A0A7W9TL33_9ACTN|nr:hypothetical protein [Streptomyces paradoxus]
MQRRSIRNDHLASPWLGTLHAFLCAKVSGAKEDTSVTRLK